MEKQKLETDKSKLPVLILTHGNDGLCQLVQGVLIGYGMSFGGAGTVTNGYNSGLILARWNKIDEKLLYHDGADTKDAYVKNKPNALVFDARTQMPEILEHFSGSKTPTMEMVVPGYLLNLIRSSPGDEMVAGFIRRDLGLAIPESVHKSGSDAVLSWIMENSGQVKIVAPKPATHKLKLQYREDVSGSISWTRTDTVTVEMDVPAEVVNRSIGAEDFSIVESWMANHIGDGWETRRSEGEEEHGDYSDDTDYEFYELLDDRSLLHDELERLAEHSR